MSDIYKYAAKNGIRFPSSRGNLMAEQLFAMPLKAANGFDLQTVDRTSDNELKTMGQTDFVGDGETNPRKKELEVSLDIVKDIIGTKKEDCLLYTSDAADDTR